MVGGSNSGANELIDLSGDSSAAATNIPKLSAPKKSKKSKKSKK